MKRHERTRCHRRTLRFPIRRPLVPVLLLALATTASGQILPPPILPPPILLPPPVNFDGLAAGTLVSTQYIGEGVIFDGSPRVMAAAPVAAASNPNVLESRYAGDIPFHKGPLKFRFTSLQRKVSVAVGDRYTGGPDNSAILRAYDDAGRLVKRASVHLGTGRHDVKTVLSVDAGSNRIRRAEVFYAWETSLDGVPIEVDQGGVETIDNVYFEGDAPPPPPPDDPPVVRITRPADGAIFFGDRNVRFQGAIAEDNGLGSVALRQEFPDTGEAPITASLDWTGSAPNFTFPRFPDVFRLSLHPGRNVITVTAVDSAGQSASASITVQFGPAPEVEILSPAADSTTDATLINVRGRIRKELGSLRRTDVRIGVTAGSETPLAPRVVDSLSGSAPEYTFRARVPLSDLRARTSNTVTVTARDEGGAEGSDSVRVIVDRPDRIGASVIVTQAVEGGFLVAGRRTVVRATPQPRVSTVLRGIPAVLRGFRGATELPGSPIRPVGSDTIDIFPGDDYADRHGDVSKTWNFLLPSSWTGAGETDLVVQIDPDNSLEECETCQENNAIEVTASFTAGETLRIRPVRMTTRHPDGMARTPTAASALASLEAVRRVYPYGRLEILPPVVFTPSRLRDVFGKHGKNKALEDLYERYTCWDSNSVWGWIEDTFTGCDWDTYVVGIVSNYPRPDGGLSLIGGLAYLNSPGCVSEETPWVLAQELAHDIGRSHGGNGHGESGGGGYDHHFPNPHGTVAAYGFDTTDWVAVRPQYSTSASAPSFLQASFRRCDPSVEACFTHDFMSYGANPHWISSYTWNGILLDGFGGSRGGIGGEAVAGGGAGGLGGVPFKGTVIHVRGTISDGEVSLRPFYTLDAPDGFAIDDGEGSFEAVALGAADRVLARRVIEPRQNTHTHGERFSFLLPFPDGTRAIELLSDGELVERRAVSASAPTVEILDPAPGTVIGADDLLAVNWRAGDADGDALTYGVKYSSDGGESWITLAMGLEETAFEIDAAELPGGQEAMIRVLATDGLLSSTSTSGVFTVADRGPYVVILSPRDRAELGGDDLHVFEASAVDLEDGSVPGKRVRWFSDVDGLLGKGRVIDVESLSKGRHVIRVEATDSQGNAGETTIEVYVDVPAPPPDGGNETAEFIRGEINGDGSVDIADPISLLTYLFIGGTQLGCEDAADANDDGEVNLTDSVYLLNFLFNGGPRPRQPYPRAGTDPTDDGLGCESGR